MQRRSPLTAAEPWRCMLSGGAPPAPNGDTGVGAASPLAAPVPRSIYNRHQPDFRSEPCSWPKWSDVHTSSLRRQNHMPQRPSQVVSPSALLSKWKCTASNNGCGWRACITDGWLPGNTLSGSTVRPLSAPASRCCRASGGAAARSGRAVSSAAACCHSGCCCWVGGAAANGFRGACTGPGTGRTERDSTTQRRGLIILQALRFASWALADASAHAALLHQAPL